MDKDNEILKIKAEIGEIRIFRNFDLFQTGSYALSSAIVGIGFPQTYPVTLAAGIMGGISVVYAAKAIDNHVKLKKLEKSVKILEDCKKS